MKEHAKKALKHDISVAGKTIPTLAIAALFLIGGTSAALLSSFGTVEGTADVDQSVLVNGGDHTSENSFAFDTSSDSSFAAGTSYTGVVTLENTADVSASVKPSTTYGYAEEGNDTEVTEGIRTEYLPVDTVEKETISGSADHNASAEVRISDGSDSFDQGTVLVDATTDWNSEESESGDLVEAGFTVKTDHDVASDQEEITFDINYETPSDYTKNAPDWVAITAEDSDGNEETVISVTVDGNEVTLPVDGTGDIYQTADLQGDTIKSVRISTGTSFDEGAGQEADITYSVDSVIEDFEGASSPSALEVESGETEAVGLKNEFDIALAPEDYSVKTEFLTHDGQSQ